MHTRLVGVLALALFAAPVAAQVVTGRVIREDGRTPVAGAVITLVHDNDRIRPVLSDVDGRFSYRNAPTGNWIVRADAAGFGMNFSEAFRMGPRDSVEVTVRVTPFAEQLAKLPPATTTRCISDPASNERTGVVWAAIRSTLEASMATERERQTPLEITVLDHTLDLSRVRKSTTPFKKTRSWSGIGFRAYSPAVLDEIGYVRVFADSAAAAKADRGVDVFRGQAQSAGGLSTMIMVEREQEEREYYLPDADVLMSQSFIGGHCFTVVERAAANGVPRAVGLAFTPSSKRTVGEVTGTLWLDPVTAALRQLDVDFLIPGRAASLPNAKALIDFAQLPTGRWIVSHWSLLMPMERSQRNSMDNGFELKLAGWAEREGIARVLPLAEASSIAPGAVVRGRVLDGTTGKPLTDAAFTLESVGTELTDSTGRFLFRIFNPLSIPLPVQLTMRSERANVLNVVVPPRAVRFKPGDTVEVNIAIPSTARMRPALCGGVLDSLTAMAKGVAFDTGTVIGRVTNNAEGVEDALVVANWYLDAQGKPTATRSATMARRATKSGFGGRYALCAVPENVPVIVHAESGNTKGATVTVTTAPGVFAEAFVTVVPGAPPARTPSRP